MADEPLANLEAEAAFLGAVLIENSVLDALPVTLREEHFFEPVHSRIFAAIVRLRKRGKVTPVVLKPYFEADAALKELGGIQYLAALTADGQGLLAPRELAEQIIDLATRRALLARIAEATTRLREPGEKLPDVAAMLRSPDLQPTPPWPLLTPAELEALPPPEWLIDRLLPAEGLAVLYGDPAAGKSFLALDLALRLSLGREWHGRATKRTGVLYIAGEGARGFGKRVAGWRIQHGLDRLDAPFRLLPVAVQVLDPAQRSALSLMVERASREADFQIGLTILDTVSRAIAGMDENAPDTMSGLVAACDELRGTNGGIVLGVHHAGKDRDRGMRGSSVLLGAVDTAIRVTKSERIVTVQAEKQKDGEQGPPIYFEMDHVEWQAGDAAAPGPALSTLVPRRTDSATTESEAGISGQMIHAAFGLLADAWADGRPFSHRPETRKDGRFAPKIFASRLGGETDAWALLLASWLENDCLAFEVFDKRSKVRGLRVLQPL